MQIYLWIALGSALGGAGRYWCSGPLITPEKAQVVRYSGEQEGS